MELAPMLFYVAINAVSPGPNNLMAMYLGAAYGLRGARKFMLASMLSFTVKVLLCGTLNLALAAAIPAAVPYLKWVGAAYMLYMAASMAAKGFKGQAQVKEDGTRGESTYRSGVLLQLLNIKSWILGLSVFSIYVIPYTSEFGVILAVSLICGACMIAATLMWALGGRALQRAYEKHVKAFSIAMALSLAWCAAMAVM